MAASANSAGFTDLCLAVTAVVIYPFFLELESGSGTWTSTTRADEMVRVLVPLAATATVALFAAVAFMYLHHAAAVGAGNRRRRLSGLVTFALCGAAGTLQFVLFVLPDDAAVTVEAVGRTAVEALPAAATVVFFLGMALLLIAHIRAGGEGGGTLTGAVADDDDRPRVPMWVVVRVMTKAAYGAAAALLFQIAVAALYAMQ